MGESMTPRELEERASACTREIHRARQELEISAHFDHFCAYHQLSVL